MTATRRPGCQYPQRHQGRRRWHPILRRNARAARRSTPPGSLTPCLSPSPRVHRALEQITESKPRRNTRQHLVRVEIEVVDEGPHLHGIHSEVGEDAQVASRLYLVEVVWILDAEIQTVQNLAGERRLLGGGHVRQQRLDVITGQPDRDEIVVVNGGKADRLALAGLSPQCRQQQLEPTGHAAGERRDLPCTVLAIGDDGEVCAALLHALPLPGQGVLTRMSSVGWFKYRAQDTTAGPQEWPAPHSHRKCCGDL